MNPKFLPALRDAGLVFSGHDNGGLRMEIVELPRKVHPFFLATQYVPRLVPPGGLDML